MDRDKKTVVNNLSKHEQRVVIKTAAGHDGYFSNRDGLLMLTKIN